MHCPKAAFFSGSRPSRLRFRKQFGPWVQKNIFLLTAPCVIHFLIKKGIAIFLINFFSVNVYGTNFYEKKKPCSRSHQTLYQKSWNFPTKGSPQDILSHTGGTDLGRYRLACLSISFPREVLDLRRWRSLRFLNFTVHILFKWTPVVEIQQVWKPISQSTTILQENNRNKKLLLFVRLCILLVLNLEQGVRHE